jgi:hypothetical protein
MFHWIRDIVNAPIVPKPRRTVRRNGISEVPEVLECRSLPTVISVGDPFLINTLDAKSEYLDIDQNIHGNSVVTYSSSILNVSKKQWEGVVCVQRLDNLGHRVGTEIVIRNPGNPQSSAIQSDVALADDGSFVVVWRRFSLRPLQKNDIFLQRFNSAGQPLLKKPLQLDQKKTLAFDPQVENGANGTVVVGWETEEIGDNFRKVVVQRLAFSGKKAVSKVGQQIGIHDGMKYDVFQLESNSSGDFAVAWFAAPQLETDDDGKPLHVGDKLQVRKWNSNGTPATGVITVAAIPSSRFPLRQHLTELTLGLAENGDFVVGWSMEEDFILPSTMFTERFTAAGQSATGPIIVTPDVDEPVKSVRLQKVIPLDGGNWIVIWQYIDFVSDYYGSTRARTYSPQGIALAETEILNPEQGIRNPVFGVRMPLDASIDSNGRGVVVLLESSEDDGSKRKVDGILFTA